MLQTSFYCIALYYITIAITPWSVILAFVLFSQNVSAILHLFSYDGFYHLCISVFWLFVILYLQYQFTEVYVIDNNKHNNKNKMTEEYKCHGFSSNISAHVIDGQRCLYYKESAGVYRYLFFLFIRKKTRFLIAYKIIMIILKIDFLSYLFIYLFVHLFTFYFYFFF